MGITIFKILCGDEFHPFIDLEAYSRLSDEGMGESEESMSEYASRMSSLIMSSPGVLWPEGKRATYPDALIRLVEVMLGRENEAGLVQVGGNAMHPLSVSLSIQ